MLSKYVNIFPHDIISQLNCLGINITMLYKVMPTSLENKLLESPIIKIKCLARVQKKHLESYKKK